MIKEYGDGAFQTLSMRVRQDSEVAELRGWKGVDLLVHSLHDDGSGKDCQVTLDLEAGDLSRLIVQLQADLERKVSRLKSEHDERITDLLIDFLFRTKAVHETVPPNTLIGKKLKQHGISNYFDLFSSLFQIDGKNLDFQLSKQQIEILADSLRTRSSHELFSDDAEMYSRLFLKDTYAGRTIRNRIANDYT